MVSSAKVIHTADRIPTRNTTSFSFSALEKSSEVFSSATVDERFTSCLSPNAKAEGTYHPKPEPGHRRIQVYRNTLPPKDPSTKRVPQFPTSAILASGSGSRSACSITGARCVPSRPANRPGGSRRGRRLGAIPVIATSDLRITHHSQVLEEGQGTNEVENLRS